jgi:hypothetical protein
MAQKEFFRLTKTKAILGIVLIIVPVLLNLFVLVGPSTTLKEILTIPLLTYVPVMFISLLFPHFCYVDVCGPNPFIMILLLILYAYVLSCFFVFLTAKIGRSHIKKTSNNKK